MSLARQIAVDGPAGVGKSVVSQRVAQELGYLYFDSGAVYRAVTLAALRRNTDVEDASAMADLVTGLSVEVLAPAAADGRQYTVLVDGEDVTWDIFGADVDATVSIVASHPDVRRAVLPLLRQIGSSGIVMAGRDISTVVLPDADLKIYLEAAPEVRARRRYEQLRQRDIPVELHMIEAEMRRRDELDKSRATAPLRPSPGAIIVDTDDLSIEDCVDHILGLARQKNC